MEKKNSLKYHFHFIHCNKIMKHSVWKRTIKLLFFYGREKTKINKKEKQKFPVSKIELVSQNNGTFCKICAFKFFIFFCNRIFSFVLLDMTGWYEF